MVGISQTPNQLKIESWLACLETKLEDPADYPYLWPRTPTGNLQAEILQRVGASDYWVENPLSRPSSIVKTLQSLIDNYLLTPDFVSLDLCCGDGLVLWQIGRKFFRSKGLGIDLIRYPQHDFARQRGGCSFYYLPVQYLIEKEPPPAIIDVGIMLNTFRGWDRAHLHEKDWDLPQRVEKWMRAHFRFVFLTINREQREWLKREGWFIWDVGPGEDQDRMICGFPCQSNHLENPRFKWTWDPEGEKQR